VKASSLEEIKRQLQPLESKEQELQKNESQIKSIKDQAEALVERVRWRLFWPDVLSELRTILLTTEKSIEEARPGLRVGVWIENFGTAVNPLQTESTEESSSSSSPSIYRMDPRLLERYGLLMRRPGGPMGMGMGGAEGDSTGTGTADKPAKSTNELENIKVKFRAVNLSKASKDSADNGKLAYVVENAIQQSPLFDTKGPNLTAKWNREPMTTPSRLAWC